MVKDDNWRTIIYLVFLCLPLVSIQHFIFPVTWCVMSDICNHTWRPECGYNYNLSLYKVFSDECDMFEYNCDNRLDYEVVYYKECFVGTSTTSSPTCPTLNVNVTDNISSKNVYRRKAQKKYATVFSVPKKKLKGRRHTPEVSKLHKLLLRKMTVTKATKRTKPISNEIKKNNNKGLNTVKTKSKTQSGLFTWIIKKETVRIDGKLMMKIVKGITIGNQ